MKSTSGLWDEPNIGATNESGWSGLPSGYRSGARGGGFLDASIRGYWWGSQVIGRGFWYMDLSCEFEIWCGTVCGGERAYSVRCIRDDN